jgi:NitT/TauT family transport system ATP-binding protein
MNRVELSNIFMNYHSPKGETSALKDINFTIEAGEFISIVGPSGCGKSTLLNIISGLLLPSSGSVLVDGEILTKHSQKLGYMFQRDHLFEWLTVWDNVVLGLRIQKKIDTKSIDTIKNLLINYNLWDFRNHYPNELSGGMRQRVALIRTLSLNPEVLLLDEPFSALDSQTRLRVSDEIYGIIKQENKTTIMVTHDIAEAISMSSKVIILSRRPAKVIKEVPIIFSCMSRTPLKCREQQEFRIYFNEILKEMDLNDDK